MPLSFTDLLRRSIVHANRQGTPLGIGVLAFGFIGIALSLMTVYAMTTVGVPYLESQIGPQASAAIMRQFRVGDPESAAMLSMELAKGLSEKAGRELTSEELDKEMVGVALGFGAKVLPFLAPAILLQIVLTIFSSAYFLVIAVRPTRHVRDAVRQTVESVLRLIGVWLLTIGIFALGALFLVAPLSLGMSPYLLLPFALLMFCAAVYVQVLLTFAPVLSVRERATPWKSIRRSMQIVNGHWWKVALNMTGAAIVVGLVTGVFQAFVGFLIQLALPITPQASLLANVMAFITLLAAAYRTIFTAMLAQAVETSR